MSHLEQKVSEPGRDLNKYGPRLLALFVLTALLAGTSTYLTSVRAQPTYPDWSQEVAIITTPEDSAKISDFFSPEFTSSTEMLVNRLNLANFSHDELRRLLKIQKIELIKGKINNENAWAVVIRSKEICKNPAFPSVFSYLSPDLLKIVQPDKTAAVRILKGDVSTFSAVPCGNFMAIKLSDQEIGLFKSEEILILTSDLLLPTRKFRAQTPPQPVVWFYPAWFFGLPRFLKADSLVFRTSWLNGLLLARY
jgi:hypothetical protein